MDSESPKQDQHDVARATLADLIAQLLTREWLLKRIRKANEEVPVPTNKQADPTDSAVPSKALAHGRQVQT